MACVVSKADLVPFAPSKEIHGDDTLREMRQVLRFGFINVPGLPLRAQIIFDRVHKQNAAASKPAGFFQISDTGELIKLAKNSIVAATILACGQNSKQKPSVDTIRSAVRSALEFATEDIVGQVYVLLDEIELHKQARVRP